MNNLSGFFDRVGRVQRFESNRRWSGKTSVLSLINVTLCFVVVTSTSMGCKHSQKGSTDAQVASIPADLEIIAGQTGGFAGRMTGYTFSADGSVVEWEGKYVGENKRGSAPADLERAATLWQHATDAGMMEKGEQARGNMTWFVTVKAGGESREVSWASWPQNGGELTEAQEFYNVCVAQARKALGKDNG
jgi:hypothetical protein